MCQGAAHPAIDELEITPEAIAIAQSALTTFVIVNGLLLIPFVVPPGRFWVGGNALSGDRRPSLLALGLLLGYGGLLAIEPLDQFFELTRLALHGYLLIALTALIWAVLLRWIWRARLLERFLQVDW
jgi:cation-transporting ATPase E